MQLKKLNKLLKHSHSLSFMILLHSPFFQIKSYFPTPFHFIIPHSHSPYKTTTNFLQITAFFQKKYFFDSFYLIFHSSLNQIPSTMSSKVLWIGGLPGEWTADMLKYIFQNARISPPNPPPNPNLDGLQGAKIMMDPSKTNYSMTLIPIVHFS